MHFCSGVLSVHGVGAIGQACAQSGYASSSQTLCAVRQVLSLPPFCRCRNGTHFVHDGDRILCLLIFFFFFLRCNSIQKSAQILSVQLGSRPGPDLEQPRCPRRLPHAPSGPHPPATTWHLTVEAGFVIWALHVNGVPPCLLSRLRLSLSVIPVRVVRVIALEEVGRSGI